jgi:Ca-activated chloride channel family protein
VISFQYPWLLLLLLVLPLMISIKLKRRATASIRFSSLVDIEKTKPGWRVRLMPVLFLMRLICVALLIVAIARPRKGTDKDTIFTEGVAMEIVVDRSSSMGEKMAFRGQTANRLEVSKAVIKDFVAGGNGLTGRDQDLIGLVAFAKYADTLCPLAHGHEALLEFLKKTQLVTVRSEDGTAIGDALALATARLVKAEEQMKSRTKKLKAIGEDADKQPEQDQEFKIKSKVIVLLTDGQNTAGDYHPVSAAKFAKDRGIKIYTIGIGSSQQRRGFFGSSGGIDHRLLKTIADTTGGIYRVASSGDDLAEIYKEIDKLEKTKVKSVQYTQYAERFEHWALAALSLLGLEIFAGCTVFRKIP